MKTTEKPRCLQKSWKERVEDRNKAWAIKSFLFGLWILEVLFGVKMLRNAPKIKFLKNA